MVFQTDIVPTLSLLLGAPIPFANLGIVITSLFEEIEQDDVAGKQLSLRALQLNARQVHRYLTEYSKLSNDVPSSALGSLTKLFSEAERQVSVGLKDIMSGENIKSYQNTSLAEKEYLAYLRGVRELCRSVWAKFDLVAITTGILVVSFSCLASVVTIIFPISPSLLSVSKLTRCDVFSSLPIAFLCALLLWFGYTRVSLAVCFVSGTVLFFKKSHETIFNVLNLLRLSLDLRASAIAVVVVFYFLGFFSNSFVVHEDKSVLFFLQTILLIGTFDMLRNSDALKFSELDDLRRVSRKQRKRDDKKWPSVYSRGVVLKLSFLMVLLVQNRLGNLFWFCREEQTQCQSSSLTKPSDTLPSNETQAGYQFWWSSMLLFLVPASLLLWLRSCGNLNDYSCSVLSTKYALPLGSFFVCLHWFLQFVPAKMLEQTPVIGFVQQILTPCLVYFCSALTLVCLIYQPLTIYFAGTRDISNEPSDTMRNRPAVNTVVEIFNRLRSEMSEQFCGKSEKVPVVYGLGTVYSSAISILLVCLAIPLAMLLGDGLAPTVTLMLIQIYGFLELYSVLTCRESVEEESTGICVFNYFICNYNHSVLL